jgi:polysaccharide biosynthesis protein PslG
VIAARRILTALLWGAAALALAAPASAQAQGGPNDFYGVIPIEQMQEGEFETLDRSEIGILRLPVIWRQVEPAPDVYNWAPLDNYVGRAAQVGVEVLPFVYTSPQWAVSGCQGEIGCQNVPPLQSAESRDAWVDFLNDLVARYGPGGEFWAANPTIPPLPFKTYQVWNEPSSPTYWKNPNAGQYAQLVKLSSDTIRAADPGARILLAGLFGTPQGKDAAKNVVWKFLGRLYKTQGIEEAFDAVALHPYAPDVEGLDTQLRKARQKMQKAGDGSAEIVVTEIGWGSARPQGDRPLIKGKKGQKRLLAQSYRFLNRKQGRYNIGGIIWYAWRDPGYDVEGCEFCQSAGLFKAKGGEKPAWDALLKFTGGTS